MHRLTGAAAGVLVLTLLSAAHAEEPTEPETTTASSGMRGLVRSLQPELHTGGGFDVNMSNGAKNAYGGGLVAFVGLRLRVRDRVFLGGELEGASLIVKDHRVGAGGLMGVELGQSVRPILALEGGAHTYVGHGTLPYLGIRAGLLFPHAIGRATPLVVEIAARNEAATLHDSYDDKIAAVSRGGADRRTDVSAMNVGIGGGWESALRLGVTFR